MKRVLDWNKYIEKAVQTVSEGIVMLENNNALPLVADDAISVFGRIQLHYYKSGTGSGGMVNVSKVTGIAFKFERDFPSLENAVAATLAEVPLKKASPLTARQM